MGISPQNQNKEIRNYILENQAFGKETEAHFRIIWTWHFDIMK